MWPTAGILLVVLFWVLVFLGDRVLSGRKFAARYRKILERTGITISLLQIRSYTRYFNKTFVRLGKLPGNFLVIWFNLGIMFSAFAMVFSVYVLCVMLYKNFTEEKPEQLLTPVIPGVNIPWRHMIYYFLTLLISGTLHEVGHAVAAARENVRIMGFGWFMLPIFCGAYVELQTDHLHVISPIRQLRIYCAGVWHNCVSGLFAVGSWWILPYVYLLCYSTNNGAVISDISKESSVYHTLRRGDQVISINNCTVQTELDYRKCIQDAAQMPNQGYCQNINGIKRRNTSIPYLLHTEHGPDCCSANSPSRFCFSHVIQNQVTHSCLPARTTIVGNTQCYTNADCRSHTQPICVKPVTSENTRLVKISSTRGQDVLFVGNPYELLIHVSVTDYLPMWNFIPLDIPDYIQTFLIYFASLSGALAILNMIPCYCLDGQWALMSFIEHFLRRIIKISYIRALIYHIILFTSTILLLVNIIFALWNLRGQGIFAVITQQENPS